MKSKSKISLAVLIILIVAIGIFATQVGFYTIQPIGALPEGSTWLVWRSSGDPFFNSADAVCLKAHGNVSLFTRGSALAQAPAVQAALLSKPLPRCQAASSISKTTPSFRQE